MKKLLCTLLTFTIVILSACDSTLINDADVETTDNTNLEQEEPAEIQYVIGEASYVPFESVQELIDSADTVIIGKVTNISFQVLEAGTGLVPTEETIWSERWLFTIYDIDVVTSYKGEVNNNIQMARGGGIKDYRAEEQLNIIREMNAHPNDSIPLRQHAPEINIGETYLFTLRQSRTGIFTGLIPQQSVYNLNNPFKKQTIEGELDNPQYYSQNEDEFGWAIISTQDIISHFGDDKWDEFWTQWQKDNPDWETRIDKAAVEEALAE